VTRATVVYVASWTIVGILALAALSYDLHMIFVVLPHDAYELGRTVAAAIHH